MGDRHGYSGMIRLRVSTMRAQVAVRSAARSAKGATSAMRVIAASSPASGWAKRVERVGQEMRGGGRFPEGLQGGGGQLIPVVQKKRGAEGDRLPTCPAREAVDRNMHGASRAENLRGQWIGRGLLLETKGVRIWPHRVHLEIDGGQFIAAIVAVVMQQRPSERGFTPAGWPHQHECTVSEREHAGVHEVEVTPPVLQGDGQILLEHKEERPRLGCHERGLARSSDAKGGRTRLASSRRTRY